MNNTKFLKKNLKGKTQFNRLGMFEKFSIYIKARLDARNALPKLEGDMWMSPFLWSKFKEYDHFVSESSVGFNDATKKVLTEMTVLLADAQEAKRKLDRETEGCNLLRLEVEARRFGEDYLSIEQVRERRVAERKRMEHALEGTRAKLHKLILDLIAKKDSVAELAVLVTQNVENLRTAMVMRNNYYFDVVLRHHPEAAKIPTNQDYLKYMTNSFVPFNPEQKLLLQSVDEFVNQILGV